MNVNGNANRKHTMRSMFIALGLVPGLLSVMQAQAAEPAPWPAPHARPTKRMPEPPAIETVQHKGLKLERVPADQVRRERFSIALNVDQSWQLDDDYQLFSGDRHTSGGGISATVNVIELAPEVSLHATVDWMREDTTGSWAFGTSELESLRLAAGGLIRYEPTWWLAPYLRVVGGAENNEVRLKGAGGALSDEEWGPFGTAGLGVSFRTWPRRLVGNNPGSAFLALNVEGGFSVAKPLDLHLHAESPNPDDDAISLTPIELGQLSRNRPYLRIALSAHF